MATLSLIRGLPGSGKSEFCRTCGSDWTFSADDYFVCEGVFKFDGNKLREAHAHCEKRTEEKLYVPYARVMVANTFSQRWEMEPYFKMAQRVGNVRVHVVDLYDGGLSDEQLAARNVHGVPATTIAKMRSRWEHDWKNGVNQSPWDWR